MLIVATSTTVSANACINESTTQQPTNGDKEDNSVLGTSIELIDDSHNIEVSYDEEGDPSFGFFRINLVDNDRYSQDDPIDLSSLKLIMNPELFIDMHEFDNSVPEGEHFIVADPTALMPPPGYPIMEIVLDGECLDDDCTDYALNGKLYVDIWGYELLPEDLKQEITFEYTAKTISGKEASKPATVTITFLQSPEVPQINLNDDEFYRNNSDRVLVFDLDEILANDNTPEGTALDKATFSFWNWNLGDGIGGWTTSPIYILPDGSAQSIESFLTDNDEAISLQIINDQLLVTLNPSVPDDEDIHIIYNIYTEEVATPDNDGAEIVIHRSAGEDSNPITSTSVYERCNFVPHTIDLMNYASTTSGTLDPSTIDLDPFIPGTQKAITYESQYGGTTYTVSVDNNGILSYGEPGSEYINGYIYYTIQNSDGVTSPIGIVAQIHNCF